MTQTLTKIQPMHAQLIPNPAWERVGLTEDGRQVFRHVTKRSRPVPWLDEKGNRVYAKHPVSGEPLYPKNKPEIYDHVEVFTVESQGNFNLEKIPYDAEAEARRRAERERQRRAQANLERLLDLMAQEDVSPDELIASLRSEAQAMRPEPEPEPELEPEEPEDEVEYPVMKGPMIWVLSDGTQLNKVSKEDAVKAEEELQRRRAEAREHAAVVPEL